MSRWKSANLCGDHHEESTISATSNLCACTNSSSPAISIPKRERQKLRAYLMPSGVQCIGSTSNSLPVAANLSSPEQKFLTTRWMPLLASSRMTSEISTSTRRRPDEHTVPIASRKLSKLESPMRSTAEAITATSSLDGHHA